MASPTFPAVSWPKPTAVFESSALGSVRFHVCLSRRWMQRLSAANLVKIGAALVAVVSLAAAVAGWIALDVVESVFSAAPELEEAAEPSRDLLEAIDATLGEAGGALGTLSGMADRLSGSADRAAEVLDEVAELTTTQIPDSLTALRDALPALIDTADVIDDTMRTLSFLGVEYRPQVPLDDAFGEVQAQLEGLPETIAAQGDSLSALAEELRASATDTRLLTEQVDEVASNLEEVRASVERYEEAVDRLDGIASTGSSVVSVVPVARVALVVVALVGLALGLVGWQLGNRLRLQPLAPTR